MMKTKYPLPDVPQLKGLLEQLLSQDVEVSSSQSMVYELAKGHFLALYRTDHGQIIGGVVFDANCAAYLGGALTMTPPQTVEESVKSNFTESYLVDAFKEILNITGRLYNETGRGHVVLAEVLAPGAPMADDIQSFLSAKHRRGGFEVSVPRYGVGHLTFLHPFKEK